MANTNARKREEIVRNFNSSVRSLLTKLEQKSRRDDEIANLERARKRISLLKTTMGDSALLQEASPFFIEYSEKILETDVTIREKFFLEYDIRGECLRRKKHIDKQDEFMFTLTDSIRNHYVRSTQQEKDEVFKEVKSMLECCLEYAILS